MAEDRIELKIRALPNATYEVSTSSQTTVAGLKRILEERTSTPPERQRLIYRGRVLQNDTTLADNALENGHTIHLVERTTDSPDVREETERATQTTAEMPGGTRISVNVGAGTSAAGLNEIGRIVHGVLNAFGVRPNAPGASATPSNPTNASPQGEPTSATAVSSVEQVPHLLLSFGNYVSRMESAGLPTRPFSLFSLAPSDPARAIAPEQLTPLTAAMCQMLSNTTLDGELQRQLQQARETLQSTGNAAVESAVARPGASVSFRSENNAVRVQSTVNTNTAFSQTPTVQYPYLPLLIATFGDAVQRVERLVREKACRSLNSAIRQFQSITEIDESNLEILIGCMLQVGSVSHWFAALFAELGRVAAGIIPALNGNMYPLALNTASVISHNGTLPNFPPLMPRGLADMNQTLSQARTQVPGSGTTTASTNQVSAFVAQAGDSPPEGQTQATPIIEQVAVAVVEGQIPLGPNIQSTPTQTTNSMTTTNPVASNPVAQSSSTPSSSQTAPPTDDQQGERRNAPAGMGSGLKSRLRQRSTNTSQSSSDTTARQPTEETPRTTSSTTASQPEGMGSLLNSVSQLIGNGGNGEGLGNLMGSIANNPTIARMTENPSIQQLMTNMMNPNSEGPDFGRILTEMAPMMTSVLNGSENASAAQTRSVTSDTGSLSVLSADRIEFWNRIMQQDVDTMLNIPATSDTPLSDAYLAGRSVRNPGSQILPSSSFSHDQERELE